MLMSPALEHKGLTSVQGEVFGEALLKQGYFSMCVLCVARRGCLARVTSYNASKLELYILYLTFKAPISKITIGFIKIYL